MDDHSANPAGRLWEFLNYMATRRSNQVQLLSACADYLGVPPVLSKDLYEGLGALVALPDDIESAVSSYNAHLPKEYLLRPLPEARTALAHLSSLHTGTDTFCAQYNDATLLGLEGCSYSLELVKRERPVTAETLGEVQKRAQAILDILAADEDLDERIKAVIYEHAESILSASNKVRVRGAAALLDERDRVIGSLVRNPETTGLIAKTSAGRNLFDLLTKITVVLTLVSTPAAIAADTLTILSLTTASSGSANDASDPFPSQEPGKSMSSEQNSALR
ncbi:hypothetical protein [Pseudarthrobacter oxydans]|uniref:hypothetical protein n=1 Tax=Pseudarthrobacter oxydans TaxID=1671 RepID=UPI00381216EA